MITHFGFSTKIFNVKSAFIHRGLDEEIYMEFLHCMSDISKDDCMTLNKCTYGLVQAMRKYYKEAVGILKKLGFFKEMSTHVFM